MLEPHLHVHLEFKEVHSLPVTAIQCQQIPILKIYNKHLVTWNSRYGCSRSYGSYSTVISGCHDNGFANNIRYLGANLSQMKGIKNVTQLTPNDNLWEKHQQSYSSALEKDLCLNLLTELSTIRSTKHVNFTNKCTQHYSFQYSNTSSLNSGNCKFCKYGWRPECTSIKSFV